MARKCLKVQVTSARPEKEEASSERVEDAEKKYEMKIHFDSEKSIDRQLYSPRDSDTIENCLKRIFIQLFACVTVHHSNN